MLPLIIVNAQISADIKEAYSNNDHSSVIENIEQKTGLTLDEKILYIKTLMSIGNINKANEVLMNNQDIPFQVSDQLMNNAAIGAYMHGQPAANTAIVTPDDASSVFPISDGKSLLYLSGIGENQAFKKIMGNEKISNGVASFDVITSMHSLNCTVSIESDFVFIGVSKKQPGKRLVLNDMTSSDIYMGRKTESGNLEDFTPFPFSSMSFPSGFPSLSEDGRILFFAADRPDGFGGWDIYKSNWDGTTWTIPKNLGPKINTAGNEITPFYREGILYFSSDYHYGMGGFDIFFANNVGTDQCSVHNPGKGINSGSDDLGFVYSKDHGKAVFISGRPGDGNTSQMHSIDFVANLLPIAGTEIVITKESAVQPSTPVIEVEEKQVIEEELIIKEVEPEVIVEEVVEITEETIEDPKEVDIEINPKPENEKLPFAGTYYVQIATFSRSQFDKSAFLAKVPKGLEYIFSGEENSIKAFSGPFEDSDIATKARDLITSGTPFTDAFVLNKPQINPLEKSKSETYSIQAATMSTLKWLDKEKLEKIGTLDIVEKGDKFVIFLIGLKNAQLANEALDALKEMGYKDAFILE